MYHFREFAHAILFDPQGERISRNSIHSFLSIITPAKTRLCGTMATHDLWAKIDCHNNINWFVDHSRTRSSLACLVHHVPLFIRLRSPICIRNRNWLVDGQNDLVNYICDQRRATIVYCSVSAAYLLHFCCEYSRVINWWSWSSNSQPESALGNLPG